MAELSSVSADVIIDKVSIVKRNMGGEDRFYVYFAFGLVRNTTLRLSHELAHALAEKLSKALGVVDQSRLELEAEFQRLQTECEKANSTFSALQAERKDLLIQIGDRKREQESARTVAKAECASLRTQLDQSMAMSKALRASLDKIRNTCREILTPL